MAFAPDYARRGRFYVYYTDRDGDTRVVEYRRAERRPRRRRVGARLVLRQRRPGVQPQRRPARCSAPTTCSTSASATAAAAATSTARAATGRTSARCSARSCASTRGRAAGGRTAIPAVEPVRRPRRRARPEIYAYGLRNPWRFSFDRAHRRPDDRRRRARTRSRRSTSCAAARARARTSAGGRSRAARRYSPGESRARPRAARHRARATPTATARSPAASWCATARCPGLRGRYVFGDFCRGRIASARLSAGRARATCARPACASPSLSSFGEDARGRVYVDLARRAGLPARARGDASSTASASRACARDNPGAVHAERARTRGSSAATPCWVVDPGPALDEHLDAVAAAVGARGGAGGIALTHDHADHVEGASAAARAPRRPRSGRAPSGRRGARRRRRVRPAARVAAPGHAARPPRVRAGARLLHRRRGARRGQRVRRPTGRWRGYLDGAARACAALDLARASAPATARRSRDPRAKLDEYVGAPPRPRAAAVAALDAGLRERATSCSTRPGPTRRRRCAAPPRSRWPRTWTSCARRGACRTAWSGRVGAPGLGLGEPRGGRAPSPRPAGSRRWPSACVEDRAQRVADRRARAPRRAPRT